MASNRLVGQFQAVSSAPTNLAFVMCPLAIQPVGGLQDWQRMVYQFAYDQAVAVVKPSRLERLQAVSAN